ncbi:MAG: sensor histidine kinase [Deltaproteobacteria bacterium]|nr:sensor histidine kinase [Deltaproteobacteria bacterium]MBK8237352.1 sensor histidine kinase [Deltaproteobacteria bacterium]MBK8720381.1 sensor histidine kinase [Deltaproteobacteria bacterium]MBP7285478.1 sensor histidine kinase [Nannocystaceae bacterium]
MADQDELHARISQLERALAASEGTVAALMDAAEESNAKVLSAAAVAQQSHRLAQVIARKTQESDAQREALARALRELTAAQTELTHSQKLTAIGQLAAGVAHEINTPIQYVGDNLTFLQKVFEQVLPVLQAAAAAAADEADGRARLSTLLAKLRLPRIATQVPRAIEQSLDGVSRVAKIVGAMKDFSHPSGGEMSEVDLRKTIESTVTIARNEWKYVAELELDIPDDLPPVLCLRDELNQVVLNLVVNAAHAIAAVVGESGAHGTIRVSASVADDWCEIRVSDTGIGIPPELREKVFEPFFTTKPVGKGTGQGLAIAYAVIVEKHHGMLTLESEVGRGTTFIIRIPSERSMPQLEAA